MHDETTDAARPARVWSASVHELHDRWWASRAVRVVRTGEGGMIEAGPVLYLLLAPGLLVDFGLRAVVRRLHWAAAPLVRLRVVDGAVESYRERVIADTRGNLVAVRRTYDPADAAVARAWLTPDRALARTWAGIASTREAVVALGEARDQAVRLVVRGRVEHCAAGDGAEPRDGALLAWLAAAVGRWSQASAVFADVYEAEPGVLIHRTAEVSPRAVVIGPAWIGAGVRVPEGAVVAGPVAVPDAVEADAPGPVPWEDVRSARWSLPSLARRGVLSRAVKRGFDVVFSLAVLAATLPLYPLIMLLIWREDGRPFFFAHTRQTLGGRDFPCLKFRTMCRDAEKMKLDLAAVNKADGPQFFMDDDPRQLKIGRALRKFQLDELPQFLNVLAGHMSVVGPRPSPDRENQYCPAWREARLSVRPGVTGLWQVRRTREPETDFQEWIRYDLEYVQHQSFWFDMFIIGATIRRVLGR